MRRAVTAAERLLEAREELRLYRWLCDMALAAWPSPVPEAPLIEPPAPATGGTGKWPLWQAPWLHERCRPVVLER